MRALLVVNPNATTTTARVRDVLVRALASQVDLRVAYTEERGHAAQLAREATQTRMDLIVTLGGDGTVNEVVNGMLTSDHGPAEGRAAQRPALACVPGGSTNVFARAVGLPRDWTEGTGVILEALREGRTRTIGVGRADDRFFTFCCGFGIDAEVVRRVEQARTRGATSSAALYLRATVAQYAVGAERRLPAITLSRAGEPDETALSTAMVQNTAPWTYLGDRPINCSPNASFDAGLDVMALRHLRPHSTLRTVAQMLAGRSNPHGKQILRLHDLPGLTLSAARPTAFQVDGDYLGERDKLELASIPAALRVVC